jgi:hypothetical protein
MLLEREKQITDMKLLLNNMFIIFKHLLQFYLNAAAWLTILMSLLILRLRHLPLLRRSTLSFPHGNNPSLRAH